MFILNIVYYIRYAYLNEIKVLKIWLHQPNLQTHWGSKKEYCKSKRLQCSYSVSASSMSLLIDDIPLLDKLDNYGNGGKSRTIRGAEVQKLLAGYKGLTEWLPNIDSDAIAEPSSSQRKAVSHKRLKEFIENEFDLTKFGVAHGARVGVLLPNGPELAVTVLSIVSQWCAAPINITNTLEEMKGELLSTKCIAIIILTGAAGNEVAMKAAEDLNIGVITINPIGTTCGLFRMKSLKPVASSNATTIPSVANVAGGKRTVLLLHTSGTSGNKKLVPYSLDTILVGVGCIVASWNLSPVDVCLNMMPLFHIGNKCFMFL
jgi:acyl-coenzyme A synthetase/AMP-(fatty) acid ligase